MIAHPTPSTTLAPAEVGVRVLVLSRCGSSFGPSRGGADVLSQHHAEFLARQGFEVLYVGTSPLTEPGIESVLVETRDLMRLPTTGASPARLTIVHLVNEAVHMIHGTLMATRVQRRRSVDIVISNSSIATILLRILASASRIVYYVHDSLYSEEAHGRRREEPVRYFLNHLLERIALWSANRVICPSDGIATQIVALGYPKEKLSIIHPLIHQRSIPPTAPFAPSAASISRMRPFLLSVGQQTGRKRFDLLIGALRWIPKSVRLVLVGNGPLHETYREQARALGLSERVAFLSNIEDGTLDLLYRSCATYVLASENEGFPITVAEALSHGCPVVLACPSVSDLGTILNSEHTLILRELSGEAIARGVRGILERIGPLDDETRRSIRRWATQHFPSDGELRSTYDRIFHSLLATPGPGSSAPRGH